MTKEGQKTRSRVAGPGRGYKSADGKTAMTRSVSFHPDLLAAIDLFAATRGLPRSAAIAVLVKRGLEGVYDAAE